jgi:hypothetical protein
MIRVGVAGYFLDLAVCHPARQSHYTWGVECDGASYHSVASAREPYASDMIDRSWHRPQARSRWNAAVAGESRTLSRCGSRSHFSVPEISIYRPLRRCAPYHAHQAQTSFYLSSSPP